MLVACSTRCGNVCILQYTAGKAEENHQFNAVHSRSCNGKSSINTETLRTTGCILLSEFLANCRSRCNWTTTNHMLKMPQKELQPVGPLCSRALQRVTGNKTQSGRWRAGGRGVDKLCRRQVGGIVNGYSHIRLCRSNCKCPMGNMVINDCSTLKS